MIVASLSQDIKNILNHKFTVPAWLLLLTIAGGIIVVETLWPRKRSGTSDGENAAAKKQQNQKVKTNNSIRVDDGTHSFKQPVNIDVDYDIKNDYTLLDGTSKMVLCVNMSLNMGKVCARAC